MQCVRGILGEVVQKITNTTNPTNRSTLQVDNILLLIFWNFILLYYIEYTRCLRVNLCLKDEVNHGVN